MESGGAGPQAVRGHHNEPRSRTHQAVARTKEESGEVGGRPADWAQQLKHLTLSIDGATVDARCRK